MYLSNGDFVLIMILVIYADAYLLIWTALIVYNMASGTGYIKEYVKNE